HSQQKTKIYFLEKQIQKNNFFYKTPNKRTRTTVRNPKAQKDGIARNRTWVLSDRCEKPKREVLTTIIQ
ncbi:hypothetical protein OFB58_25380, partial [Escherichia coli]|nr:hypothetical protein [Escherichia coli]